MKRKTGKLVRKALSVCLSISLVMQTAVYAAPRTDSELEQKAKEILAEKEIQKEQEIQPEGFFDAASNAIALIGGTINLCDNLASLGNDASAGAVAATIFDSIFGTNLAGRKTEEDWLEDIYGEVNKMNDKLDKVGDSVNYLVQNAQVVNQKLDVIDNKLNAVNRKLDWQNQTLMQMTDTLRQVQNGQVSISNQITTLQDSLSSQIADSSKAATVAIYNSTAEVKNANALLSNVKTYYNKFEGLGSAEQTIMDDLKEKQEDYVDFMAAVDATGQGALIREAIGKITMNFEKSYDALSEEEKALLDTKLEWKSYNDPTVKKFLSDYMKSMHTYMADTIYQKNSGYTSNMYDTVKLMGDYILGNVSSTGNIGIGESYYKLSMLNCSTSDEVHESYREFMDGIVTEYYTTAYLCMLSMSYNVAYEVENNGNSADIRTSRTHIKNIEEQVKKITAYLDYEYAKCVTEYDFNDYIHSDFDQYLCYYGNQKNAEIGIKNWLCRHKKDVYVKGGLSAANLKLAMGEQKDLHLYYGTKDVTKAAVWSSSNENAVMVNPDGTVAAIAQGEADITAVYEGAEYVCKAVVGSALAIKNGSDTSKYHYADAAYECKTQTGYDYYYNVNSYLAKSALLSEESRSVGITALTELSEKELEQFTWSVASEGVADVISGQLYAVDKGKTAVFGYRYWEDEDLYEYIGIPVESTRDVSAGLEKDQALAAGGAVDYSGYTKISSKEDLVALANNPDGWGMKNKYVLTEDIDLGGMEWTPIGYAFSINDDEIKEYVGISKSVFGKNTTYYRKGCEYRPFMGTFDGNGHTISNFKITKLPYQDKMAAALTKMDEAEADLRKEVESPNVKGGKDLNVITLGLFGATQFENITNLNVFDARIDLEYDPDETQTVTLSDGQEIRIDGGIAVYAGVMIGRSYANIMELFEDAIGECQDENGLIDKDKFAQKVDLDEAAMEAFWTFYTKQIAELEKQLTNEGKTDEEKREELKSAAAENLMVPIFWQLTEDYGKNVTSMKECYAEGSIKLQLSGDKGTNYVGMLAGTVTTSLLSCRAKGDINITSKSEGVIGGLVGKWDVVGGDTLRDCQADVTIASEGLDTLGGLVGCTHMGMAADMEFSGITPQDFETFIVYDKDKNPSESNGFATKNELCVGMLLISALTGGELRFRRVPDLPDLNVKVSGCRYYGDLSGQGNAGGLIGTKDGYHAAINIKMKPEFVVTGNVDGVPVVDMDASLSSENASFNMDIDECYVVSDVKTTGEYAGGILGYSDVEENDKVLTEKADVRGAVQNCYFYGNVKANKIAAGIAGGGKLDYADVKNCIAVSGEIVAGDGTSSDCAATPTVSDTNCFTIDSSTLYYYDQTKYLIQKENNLIEYSVKNIAGTEKTADDLNKIDTYRTLWANNLFLEVAGRLDVENGVIPSYISIRCSIPVETARKYYKVGDTFEPLTQVRANNGVQMQLVDAGVESTTPDMSKPGIRQVKVSYQGYSATYPVVIYPAEDCCLKVTSMPTMTRKADRSVALSGGELAVYNNLGEPTKTLSTADCETALSEDGKYYTLQYKKMTTAAKVVNIYVYSNSLSGGPEPTLQKTHSCLEGNTVSANDIIDAQLTSAANEVYEFKGMSGQKTFTAEKDTYLLTYYAKKDDGKDPSGDDPSGDDPSGDKPSGDNPSGETPSGDNPSGDTPSGDKPSGETVTNPPKKGETAIDDKGQASYTVLNAEKKEVSYQAPKDAKATKITVPDTVTIGGQRYQVTAVEKAAFKGNKKITQVTIGKNVTQIGANAFKGCTSLKKIMISDKVTVIGANAFDGCKKLSTVKLGSKVKTIGDRAFAGCTKLTKITIPKNVTSIGKNAFYGCKNLKSVTIKTKKLKKIGKSAFKGISKKAVISVPKSKKKTYSSLLKKSGYKGKIR